MNLVSSAWWTFPLSKHSDYFYHLFVLLRDNKERKTIGCFFTHPWESYTCNYTDLRLNYAVEITLFGFTFRRTAATLTGRYIHTWQILLRITYIKYIKVKVCGSKSITSSSTTALCEVNKSKQASGQLFSSRSLSRPSFPKHFLFSFLWSTMMISNWLNLAYYGVQLFIIFSKVIAFYAIGWRDWDDFLPCSIVVQNYNRFDTKTSLILFRISDVDDK